MRQITVTDVYLNEGMLPSTLLTRILWPTTIEATHVSPMA